MPVLRTRKAKKGRKKNKRGGVNNNSDRRPSGSGRLIDFDDAGYYEKRKQAAKEKGKLEEFLREERHKKAGISYTYM